MKPAEPSSELRNVARAAAQWLALMESGTATEQDRVQLQQWRDSAGAHESAWQKAQLLRQRFSTLPSALAMAALDRPEPGRRALLKQALCVAAVVPTAWLLICTLTAGWQKAFSSDAKVGFLAIANKFQAMIDSGNIPPQYTESQLAQLVFNNRLDAGLTIFFMVVVVVLALFSIKTALAALKEDKPTAKETPYQAMPADADSLVTQAKRAH